MKKHAILKKTLHVIQALHSRRSEIPSNLKSTFRMITTITPDYGTIIEVSLHSFGFERATLWAKKVVQVREEAAILGAGNEVWRNGKIFLAEAEKLKNEASEWGEEAIIASAIMRAGLPMFSSERASIFEGVCKGAFLSGAQRIWDARLREEVEGEMRRNDWHCTEGISAALEGMHEGVLRGVGVVVVGESFTGKSVGWKVLASAMGKMEGGEKVVYR